ncbi:MAG TPA: hypothetical protein P5547_08180 [Spirochaetota bacterium]|nr:hypothetical protein [Spirochaetota bacterium]HRR60901.1 hypothetical protein [Spirochaetota bacterium]HRV15105.1 hypothetical protein [Spirochaetota bacterium]
MKVYKGILLILLWSVYTGCSTADTESLSIEGQVMLCGEGMEGVCVALQHPQYGSVETYTDDLGMYHFKEAWAGDYSVTPFVDGCEIVPVKREVSVFDNTVVNDFIIRPLWERTYGSDYQDVVNAMTNTRNCGYVYAGSTDLHGSHEAFAIRLNAMGTMMWYNTYGRDVYHSANAVLALDDGGCMIAGSKGSSQTNVDIWVAKIDGNGALQWQRTYGGNQYDEARSIVNVNDGYCIAGCTESFGNGKEDVYVIKINDDGTVIDSTYFGGVNDDRALKIIKCKNDSGFLIAGITEYENQLVADSWVVKLNPDLELSPNGWTKEYAIALYDCATDILELDDGSIIVCGWGWDVENASRIWVSKLRGDGSVEEWTKEYYIGASCAVNSMIQRADGSIVLTGYTMTALNDEKDILLLALDNEGNVLWTQVYGSGNEINDEGKAMVLAGDGGISVACDMKVSGVAGDVHCLKVNDKGLLR